MLYCIPLVIDQKQPLEMFYEKDVPKNLQNWVENFYVRVSLLTKLRLQYRWLRSICPEKYFKKAVLKKPEACNLLKKRLWNRCFPVNFEKFLRKFFYRTSCRTPPDDCFCTFFLIITASTVNISDVCLLFKLKKVSKNLNLVSHFH